MQITRSINIVLATIVLAAIYASPALCRQEVKHSLSISVPPGYHLMINGNDTKAQKLDATAIYADPVDGLFQRVMLVTSEGNNLCDASGCAYYSLTRGGDSQGARATAGIMLEDLNGGTHIKSVMPQSPAEQAGMVAGQWISQVNGLQIKTSAEAASTIRGLPMGVEAMITVITGDKTTGKVSVLKMIPRAMFGTGVIKLGRIVPADCDFKGKTSVICSLSLEQITEGTNLYWAVPNQNLPALTVSFNMEWTPKNSLQVRLSAPRGISVWDGGDKPSKASLIPTGKSYRTTDLPTMFELRTDHWQGIKLSDGTLVDGEFVVDRLDCMLWKKHFSIGSTIHINLSTNNIYDLQKGRQVMVRLICGKGDPTAAWVLKPR